MAPKGKGKKGGGGKAKGDGTGAEDAEEKLRIILEIYATERIEDIPTR